MSRACEVCSAMANLTESEKPASGQARPAAKVHRMLIEERIVALCEAHAAEYRASGASTLEELRWVFAEPGGRRSLVGRRAPLDRRAFPPRPEGRRRAGGRRSADAE